MPTTTVCPQCGKPKKPWFELCFSCGQKEKQKSTCEVCGVKVEEWQTLCAQHWLDKKRGKQPAPKTDPAKKKEKTDYKDKYQGGPAAKMILEAVTDDLVYILDLGVFYYTLSLDVTLIKPQASLFQRDPIIPTDHQVVEQLYS